jgi:trimeric autotransporter adhesin
MKNNYAHSYVLSNVCSKLLNVVAIGISKKYQPLLVALFFQFIFSFSFAQAPANDLCSGAIILTPKTACNTTAPASQAAGTLSLATTTGSPSNIYGTTYDVWYQFTTPASGASTIRISISGAGTAITGTNTLIEVFNANACGSIATTNSLGTATRAQGLSIINIAPSTTYYFRVFTITNPTSVPATNWNFNVCVSYTAAPANDNCAGAISLTPGTTNTTGTLANATNSGIAVSATCAGTTADDDVWYSFVANSSAANVTVGSEFTLSPAVAMVEVFSGTCGTLTSIGCGRESVYVNGLISASTYYVRVYTASAFGTPVAGPTPNADFAISVSSPSSSNVTAGRMNEVYQQTIFSTPNILADPWEITYGSDGFLWITESKGYRLFRMNPNTGERTTVLNLSRGSTFFSAVGDRAFNIQFDHDIQGAQGGFAGMALHPKFLDGTTPQNFVYISYVHSFVSSNADSTGNFFINRLVRFTYNTTTGKLESPVSLCDTLPGSNDHNSQRIIIAPVGGTDYLFYASGDMGSGQFRNKYRPMKAQNIDSYDGKILRFNLLSDGDAGLNAWVPNDNPFNATLGVQSAVWVTGIRNNQGFAYDTVLNILYGSSHGPYSDDEINIIESGKNYGHPLVIGYAADGNYDGITAGAPFKNLQPGKPSSCPFITTESANVTAMGTAIYKDPLFSAYAGSVGEVNNIWNTTTGANATWPSEGWSGLDLYTHTLVPGWNKSLVAGSLKWGRLVRLKIGTNGTTIVPIGTRDTASYFGSTNRFRDLAFAPNGKDIYVIMDRNSTTSGPSAGNPIVPACAGCVQKYSFLGYADASGKSSIPASIDVTAGIANSCATGTTVTIDNTNNTYWVPITGPDGNIMAEINANGQNLGTVTSSFYKNSGAVRVKGSVRYLDRNITITPQTQPASPVKIRLYFSKAEYDALDADALSGVNAIADVKILKNNDGCVNTIGASTTLINPTFSEAHGTNGYMLQGSISGFSSFYFASANVVLPLNLITFTGSYKNEATLLKWETENEAGTDYFVVERSELNGNYQSIGTVQAKGNVDEKAVYNFTDGQAGSLGATVLYYRLRIVDKDGKTSYSPVVVINIADVVTSLSVYPNPAKEEATLSITCEVEQTLSWQIIDNTGRVLLTKQAVLRKGNNNISIDVRTLPAGTYFIKVTGKTVQAIQKLQKQ